MSNLVRGVGLVLVMTVVLTGCIRPVDETDTPVTDDTASPAGEVATTAPITTNWPIIERWIRARGDVPTNLEVWYDQPLNPDQLQGFSYTSSSSLPCMGFLLTSFSEGAWQAYNGAVACSPGLSFQALGSAAFFLTSSGVPYTVVFGRVEDATISDLMVVYNDGTSQAVNPAGGGFLTLKEGVWNADSISARDTQGTVILPSVSQLPAS